MGLGDDILCTVDARRTAEKHGRSVRMPYASPVWENNPFIDMTSPVRSPAPRHYLGGQRSKLKGPAIGFSEWKAEPGEIYLTDEEKKLGAHNRNRYLVLEPNVTGAWHASNKNWGIEKWRELARQLREEGRTLIQFAYPDKLEGTSLDRTIPFEKLDHALKVPTTFREALGFLSNASLYVGTDGALHHAAAALGVPAVVIWGGFSSPRNLGYDTHTNIYDEHPDSPCGRIKTDCPHCRERMDAITVDRVFEAIKEKLDE